MSVAYSYSQNTTAIVNTTDPNSFTFKGSSIYVQTKLDNLSDEEIKKYSDWNITACGAQIKTSSPYC